MTKLDLQALTAWTMETDGMMWVDPRLNGRTVEQINGGTAARRMLVGLAVHVRPPGGDYSWDELESMYVTALSLDRSCPNYWL